jgi:hypothetical protein
MYHDFVWYTIFVPLSSLLHLSMFICSFIQVRMLERDWDALDEGSGAMLFEFLKCVLMLLPQSTCYRILRDRLASLARFRQSTHLLAPEATRRHESSNQRHPYTQNYVARIRDVRELHCEAAWKNIRQGSLEVHFASAGYHDNFEQGSDRRLWLGYDSKEAEQDAKLFRKQKYEGSEKESKFEELKHDCYQDLDVAADSSGIHFLDQESDKQDSKPDDDDMNRWIHFWTGSSN